MGNGLQLAKAEKTARAFDRVDCAEDAAECHRRRWFLLERNEIAVQLIEVLVAFDQKVFHYVLECIHGGWHHSRGAIGSVATRPRSRSDRCGGAISASLA